MAEPKNCFIIMPISTPDQFIKTYRDGEEHFGHVLECLFMPSIRAAGYNPILPTAQGSDLIHAEIVGNLETSDLVLCDMSCLNPNVFFEFGIRCALNKPVCVVKDEITTKVPFDTAILNHQEYQSSLNPWDLETEIKSLVRHLTASAERSKGTNTLWRLLGLKSEAVPYAGERGTDAKLDYLALQFDALRGKLEKFFTPSDTWAREPVPRWAYREAMRRRLVEPSDDTHVFRSAKDQDALLDAATEVVAKEAPKEAQVRRAWLEGLSDLVIEHVGEWSTERQGELSFILARAFGIKASFRRTT